MSTRASRLTELLAAFLGCVVFVLVLALVVPVLLPAAPGAFAIGACILLGLAWMIVGWLFVPSVETYIGQGAMRGVPIIGPSFANPERSAPVMEDLAWKLSSQTDVGIVLAVLGFLLMSVGFVFSLDPAAGLALLVVFGIGLGVALGAVLAPPRRRAPE